MSAGFSDLGFSDQKPVVFGRQYSAIQYKKLVAKPSGHCTSQKHLTLHPTERVASTSQQKTLVKMSINTTTAIIKCADMSVEMQQSAVDFANEALEYYHIEKDIAAHIKKVCDMV